MRKVVAMALVVLGTGWGAAKAKKKAEKAAPLDQFVAAANARTAAAAPPSPGAIWSPASRLADSARDVRASQVDDILTIVVVENASAVVTGATKTSRASTASNTITALAGVTKATGPLANLTGLSGSNTLDGEGTTSRNVVISTELTARVVGVLPGGVMLVEAAKDVEINSERQIITVRGVVRQADIATDNTVQSDRLAQLEIRVNGKGVVNDATHRPFFLYRLLLGLLPF
jgi:flagellar L-ring protein precursor FlgH